MKHALSKPFIVILLFVWHIPAQSQNQNSCAEFFCTNWCANDNPANNPSTMWKVGCPVNPGTCNQSGLFPTQPIGPGTYITVPVVAGSRYQFSTCFDLTPQGGLDYRFYDVRITAYNHSGGAFIFHNDDRGTDYCSEVDWSASFTGTLRVLVDLNLSGCGCGSAPIGGLSAILGVRRTTGVTSMTWTGELNDRWEEPTNWDCYGVPDLSRSATIPGATPNNPVVRNVFGGDDAECLNIQINSSNGANVTIEATAGATMEVAQ